MLLKGRAQPTYDLVLESLAADGGLQAGEQSLRHVGYFLHVAEQELDVDTAGHLKTTAL